jgi:hypothetical protein
MSQFIELLREHKQSLIKHCGHQLDQDKRQAINAMLSCKTSLSRQTNWCCSHCSHHEQHPLSCGHRHCPQCQHQTTMAWLTRQRLKLLPSQYFMVTFTLPFEFRVIVASQPKALYQLMFQVASKVMKGFAQRQHQGEMGYTMVLHTHNRRRDIHPHIHIILPCGYYQKSRQQWHKGDGTYLYNELALASVWRAKILDAFNDYPTLTLPKRYPRKWIVNCIKVGYGEHAFEYLSRYLYRGVLPDKDIIRITDKNVTFKYVDSETKQTKTRKLPILEFLWLILQHVLPKGLQRVRDVGFLRGNAKKLRLRIQLLLLNTKHWTQPASPKVSKAIRTCPCCQHEMTCLGVSRLSEPKGLIR